MCIWAHPVGALFYLCSESCFSPESAIGSIASPSTGFAPGLNWIHGPTLFDSNISTGQDRTLLPEPRVHAAAKTGFCRVNAAFRWRLWPHLGGIVRKPLPSISIFCTIGAAAFINTLLQRGVSEGKVLVKPFSTISFSSRHVSPQRSTSVRTSSEKLLLRWCSSCSAPGAPHSCGRTRLIAAICRINAAFDCLFDCARGQCAVAPLSTFKPSQGLLSRRRCGKVCAVFWFASVAQLAEQLTLNQLVLGSSPSRGTTFQAENAGIASTDTELTQNSPDPDEQNVKWPKRIKYRNRALATIYRKTARYPSYRVCWRANGRRQMKAYGTNPPLILKGGGAEGFEPLTS